MRALKSTKQRSHHRGRTLFFWPYNHGYVMLYYARNISEYVCIIRSISCYSRESKVGITSCTNHVYSLHNSPGVAVYTWAMSYYRDSSCSDVISLLVTTCRILLVVMGPLHCFQGSSLIVLRYPSLDHYL